MQKGLKMTKLNWLAVCLIIAGCGENAEFIIAQDGGTLLDSHYDLKNGEKTAEQICRSTSDCKEKGKCTPANNFNQYYRCVASNDTDCRSSYECKTDGRCYIFIDRCAVAATEDCKNLTDCKAFGHRCYCSYSPFPTTEEEMYPLCVTAKPSEGYKCPKTTGEI